MLEVTPSSPVSSPEDQINTFEQFHPKLGVWFLEHTQKPHSSSLIKMRLVLQNVLKSPEFCGGFFGFFFALRGDAFLYPTLSGTPRLHMHAFKSTNFT